MTKAVKVGCINLVFTTLHAMQTRASDEKAVRTSVRLSVCPSVWQTRGLWQNEREICPDFYAYERSFSLVFWKEEWLVGATPTTWNFGSTGPALQRNRLQTVFARSESAVTPSEKSSTTTNRKSATRLPMSLWWSSYVAPKHPNGDSKPKTADFRLISHFVWRKSATKFFW